MLNDQEIRCIKLPSTNPYCDRHKIYREKGIFINISYHDPDNDMKPATLKFGKYQISWGDGDNLGAKGPNPEIVAKLYDFKESNFTFLEVAGAILPAIITHDSEWQQK